MRGDTHPIDAAFACGKLTVRQREAAKRWARLCIDVFGDPDYPRDIPEILIANASKAVPPEIAQFLGAVKAVEPMHPAFREGISDKGRKLLLNSDWFEAPHLSIVTDVCWRCNGMGARRMSSPRYRTLIEGLDRLANHWDSNPL